MGHCTERHSLVEVQSRQDLAVFHRICRVTLFKGNELLYRENPYDRKKGHIPMLLYCGNVAIGAIGLQIRNDDAVVVRSLAVLEEAQHMGHGKIITEEAAMQAAQLEKRRLYVNSELESVGFYESLGFAIEDWDVSDLKDPLSAVQMVKVLPG